MDTLRQKWLDSLKVGDRVCINSSCFGCEENTISKIVRITPKRMFIVGNRNVIWNKHGEYNRSSIIELTPELEKQIYERSKRIYVSRIDWEQVPQQKIDSIYAILKDL